MSKKTYSFKSIVIVAAVITLWLVVWFQQRTIIDWWQLRNYTAPTNIAALATDTTMTSQAQHDFYVNHPQLDDKSAFNAVCSSGTEQTIVLGCYHPNQKGIFLYNVSDPRLNGVEQVTAAHEMLHAAYDRLSSQDRKHVDSLLENFYHNGLHDQRVLNIIADYQKSEPKDVVDEMHSVFGTEVSQLPPSLESYYQRYFYNRAKITAFAASYQQEFISRQNQVTSDDAELQQLKTSINNGEADLTARRNELVTLQAQLSSELNGSKTATYNSLVPGFNAKVDYYNSEIASVKQLIVKYNSLAADRNAIAVSEQQLEQALSSQMSPLSAH